MLSRLIIVTGKVQGVSFRYYTRQEARRLGLAGTVQNLPDGSVRIVAEGEPAALEAMIFWCRKGPVLARVDRLEVTEVAVSGFREFSILR